MEENISTEVKGAEGDVEVVIRQFNKTEEDLQLLLPIEQASFNEPWKARYFYRMVMGQDKGALMAQVKDGEYIGFLVWTLHGPKKKVEITNIAVVPAFRQTGVGKLLIETFMNGVIAGKYYETAKLNVGTNNVTAKALYEKYGFAVQHEVPNFYNSDSAYCMKCNLSAPVPYSRKQIPVQLADPTPTPAEEPKLNKNIIDSGHSNTNQNSNQTRKKNNNNNDIAAMKKPNANRKNQAKAEPKIEQTTHLVIIEPIGFVINSKPKEYN